MSEDRFEPDGAGTLDGTDRAEGRRDHFAAFALDPDARHDEPAAGEEEISVARAVSVPYAPASAAAARERMTREMNARDMPRAFIDDARLILTELVANALRHARPLPDGTVRVGWRYDAGRLEVSVTDGGSPSLPHVARASEDSLGGRGLAIVSALATDWGVRRDGATSTVWATMSLTSDRDASGEVRAGFAGSGDVSSASATS